MRPVLLATIEHTGTRFFMNLLAPLLGRFEMYADDYPEKATTAPDFLVAHVQCRGLIDRYIALRDPLIVTTMRQMDTLAASYERRLRIADLPRYLADWQRLVNLYDPLIVSVDSADRDARLAALSAAIGAPLDTDWAVNIDWPKAA